MSLTQKEVLEFMETDLGIASATLDPSMPLFSSGVIDSFSMVALITFMEKQSGITIEPIDVTLENFDTVEKIEAFVSRKKMESA